HRHHDRASCYHHQHARPPRAEPSKKAPELSKGFVRPNVDGAFTGEHEPQLPGNNRARNKKREETNNPENVGSAACASGHAWGFCNEEDDGKKDTHHIEGVEHFC